jgi:hypothetical protein
MTSLTTWSCNMTWSYINCHTVRNSKVNVTTFCSYRRQLEACLHFEKNRLSLPVALCSALLERSSVVQVFKNIPTFYVTKRPIIVLTRALHRFLYWAKSNQFISLYRVSLKSIFMLSYHIHQWFPTCGVRTPGGTWRTSLGYVKIILVMAENTQKKRIKIKTQKQSYEVLVYKERDLCASCH